MEKIEIRARDVKGVPYIPSVGDAQHLFIIYSNDKNEKFIIRGGPENGHELYDDLHIVNSPYTEQFEHLFPDDFVENSPSVVIATGADAKVLFDKMWNKAQEINAGKFDYKLPIPGCPASLCHVQNSNTIVKVLVESAGLKFELPMINGEEVWAPGIDGDIDSTMIDDFITNTNEGIKKQQEVIADLFSSFDKPEINNPKLTNADRFRILAKQEEESGEIKFAPNFNALANQLDMALKFLGNMKFNNNDDEAEL
jgi:hypothetical protein